MSGHYQRYSYTKTPKRWLPWLKQPALITQFLQSAAVYSSIPTELMIFYSYIVSYSKAMHSFTFILGQEEKNCSEQINIKEKVVWVHRTNFYMPQPHTGILKEI